MSEAMAAAGPSTVERLAPGRHGLPREQVRESQRRRLLTAATEVLAEQGYSQIGTTSIARRAGVSTSTFYKRFDDLWACLLGAYEAGAERLCARIEAACATSEGGGRARVQAGIDAALALLASDPRLALLLSAEPPSQAGELRSARSRLVARLASLLGRVRAPGASAERELRLVGGALALVSTKARRGDREHLGDLAPALSAFLLSP